MLAGVRLLLVGYMQFMLGYVLVFDLILYPFNTCCAMYFCCIYHLSPFCLCLISDMLLSNRRSILRRIDLCVSLILCMKKDCFLRLQTLSLDL